MAEQAKLYMACGEAINPVEENLMGLLPSHLRNFATVPSTSKHEETAQSGAKGFGEELPDPSLIKQEPPDDYEESWEYPEEPLDLSGYRAPSNTPEEQCQQPQPVLQEHAQAPLQHTQAPLQYVQAPLQYAPAPLQYVPPQHAQAPLQYARAPLQPANQNGPARQGKPSVGLAPSRQFLLPREEKEAKKWKKKGLGKILKENHIEGQISHSDSRFFEQPNGAGWLCIECATMAQVTDWNFRYTHCVGLTNQLPQPRCPGWCEQYPVRVTPAAQCSSCLWVAALHPSEIQQGDIIKSIPNA